MANKYWISNVAANFNDNSRWSTTSGGANNTTAPGSNDTAIFNSGGLGNCTVSANATVSSLDITTGYTGTFGFSSYDFNVGDCYLNIGTGGDVDMGSSTITCSGDFSWADALGSITTGSSTIVMTGYEKTLSCPYSASPSRRLFHVTIESGAKTTIDERLLQLGTFTTRGEAIYIASGSHYIQGFVQEGNGTYQNNSILHLNGGTVSVDDTSKLDLRILTVREAFLPAGVWTASERIQFMNWHPYKYTFASGTYELISPALRFRSTHEVDILEMDAQTNNTKFIIHGRVFLSEEVGKVIWTKSSQPVTFTGTHNQDIEFPETAGGLDIIIDKPSGKIEFVGTNDYYLGTNSTCGGFELPDTYIGTFHDEGYNVDVGGDLIIANNDYITNTSGIWTITANGNISSPNTIRLSHLRIGEDVTATRIGLFRTDKFTVLSGGVCDGISMILVYGTTDNCVSITGDVTGSNLNVTHLFIYPEDIYNEGFSISGNLTIGSWWAGSHSTPLIITGDLQCNRLVVHGPSGSISEETTIKLDMNGYDLTCNECIVGEASGLDMGYGKIFFRDGIHNIGHLYVDKDEVHTTHGYIDLGSSIINIGGNLDLTHSTIYYDDPTITLNGTDNQSFEVDPGEILPSLTINKPSGTTTFDSNIHCPSLNQKSGTLNPNGKTFDIDGNCRIRGATVGSGFANSIWNIGGNISWKGNAPLELNPDESWTLNVEGQSDNSGLIVKNSDASGGRTIVAWNSVDEGNNSKWLFNTLDNYKNINIVKDAMGAAGVALSNNFKYIADQFEDFDKITKSDVFDDVNNKFPSWDENWEEVDALDHWAQTQEAMIYWMSRFSQMYNQKITTFGTSDPVTEKWESGALAPNGMIYFVPIRRADIIKFNPQDESITVVGDISHLEDNYKWRGTFLSTNGKIYALPSGSGKTFLEIDPSTDTIDEFVQLEEGSGLANGVMAGNGMIYGIPNAHTQIVKVNPYEKTVSTFGNVSDDTLKWWGGSLAPNGMIYCVPRDINTILKINPYNDTLSTFGDISGTAKWIGGVLAPNGMIYALPFNATGILKINPFNDTYSIICDEFASGGSKWMGGILGPDGIIYGIPVSSESMLAFDPTTETYRLHTTIAGTSKWHGGVLAYNGMIYSPPRNQEPFAKIGVPVPNLPANLCHSRYFISTSF